MENEKDNSLDRSVQVEEIIEFYKDIEPSTQTDELPSKNNNKLIDIFTRGLNKLKTPLALLRPKIINILNKIPKINITEAESSESDINTHSFGLSEKGKMIVIQSCSIAISILIIIISIVLTIFLPGNEEIVNSKINEYRKSDEYTSLYSRCNSLKNEVEQLITDKEKKEEILEKIADIDNTKAELRTQITEKKHELNALNSQINQKRSEIAALDASIASKVSSEMLYTPGKYTIGKHIAAGKYYVTGTGKFMVATVNGKSKVNTTLTSTPLLVELQNNDVVKFDSKVKFTSAY